MEYKGDDKGPFGTRPKAITSGLPTCPRKMFPMSVLTEFSVLATDALLFHRELDNAGQHLCLRDYSLRVPRRIHLIRPDREVESLIVAWRIPS